MSEQVNYKNNNNKSCKRNSQNKSQYKVASDFTNESLWLFVFKFTLLIIGLAIVFDLESHADDNLTQSYTLNDCTKLYEQKDKEALKVCRIVADTTNDKLAYFTLANIYYEGIGTAANLSLYIGNLNKAAKFNYPPALRELGKIGLSYYYKNAVLATGKDAIAHLEKAAKLGDIPAQFELAKAKGTPALNKIIPFDAQKAHEELSALYAKGSSDAGFYLSFDYYHGNGVKQDKQKAIMILTELTQQGYAKAFSSLSDIYFSDKEYINLIQSYAYYYVFANCQISSKNFKKLEGIKKLLTDPSDLAKAQSLAKGLSSLKCTTR